MIIDLITNNEGIVKFVKEEGEFGGLVDKHPNNYVMVNVQIGFLDNFCDRLDSYIVSKGIDLDKFGYRILNPKGFNVGEKGSLSSSLFI